MYNEEKIQTFLEQKMPNDLIYSFKKQSDRDPFVTKRQKGILD